MEKWEIADEKMVGFAEKYPFNFMDDKMMLNLHLDI